MVMLGPGNGVGGTKVAGSRMFSWTSATTSAGVDVFSSGTGAQSIHAGSAIVVFATLPSVSGYCG